MEMSHDKRMRKKVSIFILMGMVLGFIVIFFGIKEGKEKKIEKLVVNNREELEEIAQLCLNHESYAKTYQNITVDGLFEGDNEIVQFFYTGIGIAPASKYYGFYFSKENEPAAFQNAHCTLEEVGNGEWTWSDGTDNGGKTKRILDNWFYYEAWF